MNYLLAYLAIGVVVLVIAMALHLISKFRSRSSGRFTRSVRATLFPDEYSLKQRILNVCVVPLIAAIAIVLVWPVGLILISKKQ